jgi:RNA polymerase sigma factor (sigma-70 family)
MKNVKTIGINDAVELWMSTKDERYFKQVYENLRTGLYNNIYRIIKDRDIAEDILSETFLLIVQNIRQYDPSRGAFSTWAYNIAQHASFAWLNQEKRQDSLRKHNSETIYKFSRNETSEVEVEETEEKYDYIDSPQKKKSESEILFGKLHQRAVYEIQRLSDVYRECVFDREIRGMTYKEIAIKHGILMNTVKSKIRLGREIVRHQLIEYAKTIGIDSESLSIIFPHIEDDEEM